MANPFKHPNGPTIVAIVAVLGVWLMVVLFDKRPEPDIDKIVDEIVPPASMQFIDPPAPVEPIRFQAVSPEEMMDLRPVAIWTCKHVTGWNPPDIQPGSIKQMSEMDESLQVFIEDPDWNCEPSFTVGMPL